LCHRGLPNRRLHAGLAPHGLQTNVRRLLVLAPHEVARVVEVPLLPLLLQVERFHHLPSIVEQLFSLGLLPAQLLVLFSAVACFVRTLCFVRLVLAVLVFEVLLLFAAAATPDAALRFVLVILFVVIVDLVDSVRFVHLLHH